MSEFIKILENQSITLLADVRTIPKSRHQPDFNKDSLRKHLKRHGIKYVHFKELGGLRKPSKNSVNMGWHNESFRGFADYMQKRAFANAIVKLIKMSKKDNIAIMCAEGNPYRCHRLLIADALTIRGLSVFHISGKHSVEKHRLIKFAVVKGKKITYPAD
ncbi:MAG: DUF488 domain-containing protein [Candidatus Micrarchaeaceae archaeon]